ncbi:MAG TPA: LuxR C-terminal-related transcriptional regulator [Vicinamibacterales bacterium]|jgi:DNA-binding NarL/FixJ family response regulator
MRVALVGSALERERLRAELEAAQIEVAGEFATFASAEASDGDFDAILVGNHTAADVGRATRLEMPAEALTAREIQVLELLAEGLSNKTIAARLGISDQTVKFHVASISGKLGAANRTDAVRLAVRRGLITL